MSYATETDQFDRFELFLLGEGEKKIEEKVYSGRVPIESIREDLADKMLGMSNTSDFVLKKEDHTLGNLLSEHLKAHPNVYMAGYKRWSPSPPNATLAHA